MASRLPFPPNFSSPNSSWYRERYEEECSPRSDHEPNYDSDEENQPSKLITISDSSSGLSSLESSPLVPWFENTSITRFSHSKSLDLYSSGNMACREERLPSSLVVGQRLRGMGLKDVDLTRNPIAKYIREAKEANKSPKKSPLSRQMSCPAAFSFTNRNSSGPSDRLGISGQTGLNRELSYKANSHFRSPINIYAAPEVDAKFGSKSLRLFSCPDEHTIANDKMVNDDQVEKVDSLNPPKATATAKVIEVIDLTSSEGTSESKTTGYDDHSSYQINNRRDGDVGSLKIADQNPSPLKRRVFKKTSVLTFSDDEDSDSSEQPSLMTSKENTKQMDKSNDKTSKKSDPLKKDFYKKMGILFTLSIVLLSIYLHMNPHSFCLDSEFSNNISGIGEALKAKLFGQHIAQKVITSALKNHFSKPNARKPLVFSFHGWTGIGKNFVCNIITEHFFKHKTKSPFVHKFIVPLHFPHGSEVDSYNEQLLGWIRGNVSHCSKGGLFIFDEMDKIHTGMMATIRDAILDYRGKSTAAGYQNMVFIFVSNSGGQAINDHVLRHIFDGKLRETLTLRELENIFHGIIKNTPDAWFADLLKSGVIDHLVPFLPLERTHVKQCIRQDLIKKGFHVKEARVKEIADQMDYFPQGHEFFSVSGCKKVSSKVDVISG